MDKVARITLESHEVYELIHFLIIGLEQQIKATGRMKEDLKRLADSQESTWAWEEHIDYAKRRLDNGVKALNEVMEQGEDQEVIHLREWVEDKVVDLNDMIRAL